MRYDEFVAEFGVPSGVPSGTLRKWKFRQSVPLEFVTAARNAKTVPQPVPSEIESVPCTGDLRTERSKGVPSGKKRSTERGEGVPSVPSVLTVAIPSAEDGHPEFDIMSDGYARGFPGDTWQRVNRTCHAMRRMAERTCGLGTDDATALAKTMIAEWEKLRVDCPAGEDGNVCRVAVLERVSKMDKADKKFAVHSGVGR